MAPWIEQLQTMFGRERVVATGEAIQTHSYDEWPIAVKLRQQGLSPYAPAALFHPRATSEVSQVLSWASRNRVPVTPWGAGSSVTGAPLPLHGGLCLDMSAMQRVLALDEKNLLVNVEAGIMGHVLEQALQARGLTLNHSPQSLDRSTVGGWLATRASGQFSSRWGSIEDLVAGLTVVLATGEVVTTKLAPRAAVGPDLKQFFLGAEGALGVVTEATLKIFPRAPARLFETVRFASVTGGLETMRSIIQSGLRPFLVRFYDAEEAVYLRRGDAGDHILLLGFEGMAAVAQAEYEAGASLCRAQGGELLGPETAERWMNRRFDFSVIENVLRRPGGLADTIEVAHFWDSIEPTYRALKSALASQVAEVLGHFSHVYPQGTSLYLILLGEADDAASAEARLRALWDAAMRIALEQGAAISHHHGVGLARLPYIRQELGSGIVVLERVKQALDPAGILNPGKLGLETVVAP